MRAGPDWALGGRPHSVAACRRRGCLPQLKSTCALQSAASLWWIVGSRKTEISKTTRGSAQAERMTYVGVALGDSHGPRRSGNLEKTGQFGVSEDFCTREYTYNDKALSRCKKCRETMQFIINITVNKDLGGRNKYMQKCFWDDPFWGKRFVFFWTL